MIWHSFVVSDEELKARSTVLTGQWRLFIEVRLVLGVRSLAVEGAQLRWREKVSHLGAQWYHKYQEEWQCQSCGRALHYPQHRQTDNLYQCEDVHLVCLNPSNIICTTVVFHRHEEQLKNKKKQLKSHTPKDLSSNPIPNKCLKCFNFYKNSF